MPLLRALFILPDRFSGGWQVVRYGSCNPYHAGMAEADALDTGIALAQKLNCDLYILRVDGVFEKLRSRVDDKITSAG